MSELLKLQQKLTALSESGKLCVAFSGGVDSALLVKLACDAGLEVFAVTFDSTLQPASNRESAAAQAAGYGALHEVLWVDPLSQPRVRENNRERCYDCKHALFTALIRYAGERGMTHVLDGTNRDDLDEYRPGLRALRELGIHSPLAELGLRKAQVRELAAQVGLDVAQRPSSPCLATRFPYGALLTPEALQQCARGEAALQALGFPVVRLRVHDLLARVEVPGERLADAVENAQKIEECLRTLGYRYVTLDLAGYRSGCYDLEEQHGD